MKTVIITGVSRGIGKVAAEKFLNEGWRVVGVSKSGKATIRHAALTIYPADLSSTSSIRDFVKLVVASGLKADVLVNNAGILVDHDPGGDLSILRTTLEVNLIGLIDLTEHLLPNINNGGHIISLSSGLGSLTDATNGAYSSYRISKVAINMYTRVLASRLKEKDITVSSIDPGWVKTDMGGVGAPRDPSEPALEIFELAASRVDSGFYWHRGKKKNW
jgi:NAD(P)-dependent dehydrogenase (short-subunit alcohol dehydrogenase family)